MMRLRYRDGTESDDPLFDRPLDEQRAIVASLANFNPDPSTWPVEFIDDMLDFRKVRGERQFHEELRKRFSPHWPR